MKETPRPGLYETLLTSDWQRRLADFAEQVVADRGKLGPAESAYHLARHLHQAIERTLKSLGSSKEAVEAQITLCNRLLMFIANEAHHEGDEGIGDQLVSPELILAIMNREPLVDPIAPQRPSFPLSQTHLLTNARGEHRIGHELSREIATADQIDLLCSFLFWQGYQQVRPALQQFFKRPDARLRVITTVYQGVTDPRVLDALIATGAMVRVSFDTRTTRLHAKAWLLRRNSGFSTAYIGSSNLSAAALIDGLEWNVRVGLDSASVLEKFRATFEGYWNDPSFEPYEPERDGARLREALEGAKNTRAPAQFFFELTPLPFQAAILERLQIEREDFGRRKNLVVAATGTGKTVLAAFDFKRLRKTFKENHAREPRLLFIAHRDQLLTQARETFRQVLKDSAFGELLVGGRRPELGQAVFASVQSLARVNLGDVSPTAWDIVIIDEFHHAAAETYTRWLRHLQPWILVGLTATPERFDGKDVFQWFDGHTAINLRLWDAIEQGLLVPFRYFGLKDSIDLQSFWKRGQLDLADLDGVLTGHHARARQVLRAVSEYVDRPTSMRAIGFCVGVGHARFMAEQFNLAGIRSETVLGTDDDRASRIARLESGELQALFTVDVLSEGVDIPNVDTALLLRPTESPTVFLQQLGRGLRRADGKRLLTVLDLVSTPNRSFRLESRYQALLGGTRRHVESQINDDFPLLPPGCSIELTSDAKEIVLASVRNSIANTRRSLIDELRRLGPTTSLRQFMQESGLTLSELYRGRTFTQLRREAGLLKSAAGPEEALLNKGIPRLLGFDDRAAIAHLRADLLSASAPPISEAWVLLLVGLFGSGAFAHPSEELAKLWEHEEHREELSQLLEILADEAEFVQQEMLEPQLALKIHGHYQRRQIEAAILSGIASKLPDGREGVWFCKERKIDAFFVQLNKSEADFSPSTMYKDYAQSQEYFHWQTQANAIASHERVQRNIRHEERGITPLLFVRENAKDERGETSPYLFLGRLQYVSHEGERPVSIVWRLEVPMPAAFFEVARVAI